MHVALIMAKDGSRGLPGKNMLPFRGKPLLWHTLQHLAESGCFREIFVSTNGDEIAECADSFGATVIRRHHDFAHNDRYVASVDHAIERMEFEPRTITIPQVVQPLREPYLFPRMLAQHGPGVDSVVTVTPFPASVDWIFSSDDDGRLAPCENVRYGRDIGRRSDLLLIDNAVVSFTFDAWRRHDGMSAWPYLGHRIIPVVQQRPNVNYLVDINVPDDAEWLEFVWTFNEWKTQHVS